jgi:cytochrome oxidase Cu insertion factor (SCO1/SenC/PrrC family)
MKNLLSVSLFVVLALVLSSCASQTSPAPPLVGSKAPDFNLDNTLGGQTALADYEGTPVLLFFHMAVG